VAIEAQRDEILFLILKIYMDIVSLDVHATMLWNPASMV